MIGMYLLCIRDNFTLSFAFQYQSEANNPDLASYYAKQEKAVSKHYQKVLDIFLNDLE